MTTILVTGATGFVGRRITEALLRDGAEVRALTRKDSLPESLSRAVVVRGDLATMGSAKAATVLKGVDSVIHCAGELHRPERMRALHVEGTRTLVAAAAGRVATWVQMSSAGALGHKAHGVIDERYRSTPVSEYEITKAESDAVVQRTLQGTDSRRVTLMPTIVFDLAMPNNSLRHLVNLVYRIPQLPLPDREASANYIHLDDVVLAVRSALKKPATGDFVISDSAPLLTFLQEAMAGAGRDVTLRALPKPLSEAIRRVLRVDVLGYAGGPLGGLLNRATYSSAHAEHQLGWRPTLGWKAGIKECAAWWTSESA